MSHKSEINTGVWTYFLWSPCALSSHSNTDCYQLNYLTPRFHRCFVSRNATFSAWPWIVYSEFRNSLEILYNFPRIVELKTHVFYTGWFSLKGSMLFLFFTVLVDYYIKYTTQGTVKLRAVLQWEYTAHCESTTARLPSCGCKRIHFWSFSILWCHVIFEKKSLRIFLDLLSLSVWRDKSEQ